MSRNALFLGGSKGLGLEMAKLAILDGFHPTLVARNPLNCPLVIEGPADCVEVNLKSNDPRFELGGDPFDMIVWTAGVYQEGRFLNLTDGEIGDMCRIHLENPARILKNLLRRNQTFSHPCHLVVVASSASYRVRPNEGMYSPVKAGKAQLARILGQELPEAIPGSKVLLAHPGGMQTSFWHGRGRDVSAFMDPVEVASLIWNEMLRQKKPFLEMHIDRQPDRSAKVAYGARLPE